MSFAEEIHTCVASGAWPGDDDEEFWLATACQAASLTYYRYRPWLMPWWVRLEERVYYDTRLAPLWIRLRKAGEMRRQNASLRWPSHRGALGRPDADHPVGDKLVRFGERRRLSSPAEVPVDDMKEQRLQAEQGEVAAFVRYRMQVWGADLGD